MARLFALAAILIGLSVIDARAMLKSGQKKEMIPYFALMLSAAAMGFAHLADPYAHSIVFYLLGFFHIKG